MPMTSREEYVAQLKTQIERRNAEIRRREAVAARGGSADEVERLREQQKQALSKLRRLS